MNVDRSTLLDELTWASRITEKKTTIPVLSHVILTCAGEDVSLYATDLEVFGSTHFKANTGDKSSWTAVFPAGRLISYLRLNGYDSVDLSVKGNNLCVTTPAGGSLRIVGMDPESAPVMPTVTPTIGSSNLQWAIERVLPSISKEESRFTLNGALLHIWEHGSVLVSTDGHRLSCANVRTISTGEPSAIRAILPTRGISFAKDLDGPLVIGQAESHVVIANAHRTLVMAKLNGNFPDYERVMRRSSAVTTVEISPAEWQKAIKRVSIFADERSRAIRLRLGSDLTFYASDQETGECEQHIPIAYSGANFEAGYNYTYLLDFLGLAPQDGSTYSFAKPSEAAELSCPDWRYVVMPMRIWPHSTLNTKGKQ